ncbi:hypothetical protein [Maribacter sp.]|uniref:hypothetical protein n=1 Tax=Maribacter sp. TaxID=1897614 RepID=UPI00329A156B
MSKLNIVFICGSLEPGKDGVGDYTRRLASEIIRQGNIASIIALNDTFCKTIKKENQISDTISVSTLRLSSTNSIDKRIYQAKCWVNERNVDWVSLQYVPYSFSAKGIPLNLATQLRKIANYQKWHIMFHELAVGIENEASIKHRLIGKIQFHVIKSLRKKLKPQVVHTQTQLYLKLLDNLNFKVSLLPLFSNIPIKNLKPNGKGIKSKLRNEIVLVLFGGIHSNVPFENFTIEAASYSKTKNIPISLLTLGRNGNELIKLINCAKKQKLEIRNMGEQTFSNISKILSSSTIGITTTPLALVEKSGSVAAMLAHKLDIICVSRDWNMKDPNILEIKNIYNYKKGNLEAIILKIMKNIKINNKPKGNLVSQVAHSFLTSLESK